MTASRRYRAAPLRCSHLQPLAVRQSGEPPSQNRLLVLSLRRRTWNETVWSERMAKSMSSSDLPSITARRRSCNTVFDVAAEIVQRTQTSPSSGCHSSSLNVTGERLRRGDRISVDRNGDNSTHSPTGSGSRNEQTDREKIAVLRRGMCHGHRHRALNHEGKERRYCPRIHDCHGARGAKEQQNEGPLYWKPSTAATRAPDADYA